MKFINSYLFNFLVGYVIGALAIVGIKLYKGKVRK